MKCERCGEQKASVHWTEYLEGVALDRHLCEPCQAEELPGTFPVQNELRFECRCGETLVWHFPHRSCEHPPASFKEEGRADVEIATCKCGVKFVAVAPIWVCEVCGSQSMIQPHETGERGYLHDHIYGGRENLEISIRGILP